MQCVLSLTFEVHFSLVVICPTFVLFVVENLVSNDLGVKLYFPEKFIVVAFRCALVRPQSAGASASLSSGLVICPLLATFRLQYEDDYEY